MSPLVLASRLVRGFCVFILTVPATGAFAGAGFDPGLARMAVTIDGMQLRGRITFHAVLPGARLDIGLPQPLGQAVVVRQGSVELAHDQGGLVWVAPSKPGYYPLTIGVAGQQPALELQVFVMVPASEVVDGWLNGYRIGRYPAPRQPLDAYRQPAGYIEVTPENRDVAVSPHFRLGQFVCKQEGGYPKYLVLRPGLLDKLELLLAKVNQGKKEVHSFVVMSGYRTPFYNAAIGNVAGSQHIYGGAADIFVDVEPVDNYMDDLDGGGRSDRGDALALLELADGLALEVRRPDLAGGLGPYGETEAHGPFLHVDVRGVRARWGLASVALGDVQASPR